MPTVMELCTRADIEAEIQRAAEAAADGITPKSWLVQKLVTAHEENAGDAETLYALQYCYSEHVNRYYRTVKMAEEKGAPEELLLPGFKRLQQRYVFQRQGESFIVAVEHMTAEELDAKEAEHRQMAIGHVQHAEELHSFRVAKFGEPSLMDSESAHGPTPLAHPARPTFDPPASHAER